MKLWHCKESRSLRVLWALEEMELNYELEVLQFPPRVLHKEFLQVNCLGTVPYFEDGGAYMTESSGICHYLVEKYQLYEFGLRVGEPEYATYLNWLYHSDATLTFPLAIVLRYRRMEPTKAPIVADDYAKWFFARLRLLEAHVKNREYLCGSRFTVADIAITYALYLADYLELSDRFAPQVADYYQRMTQRAAFKRANAIR